MQTHYDLLIIGGGINGTGIAADAGGRGLSVLLCEQDDLAAGTSSASSKLIHGGLRYLEQFNFKLVRSSLKEREILMRKAPHLVRPRSFIIPQTSFARSPALIKLGLFLYDHLAGRSSLPAAKKINLINTSSPLKSSVSSGFHYYDCETDDARLVIANAQMAAAKGAIILTRTRLVKAERQQNQWVVTLQDPTATRIITTKALVNAAGPWVETVAQTVLEVECNYQIKLVKGSHIIVPKFYEGSDAYLLQNRDGRVVFVIPYQRQFTLIGTTDVVVSESKKPNICSAEISYLCEVVNRYFDHTITSEDCIWTYSGTRVLCDAKSKEPAKMTREYLLVMDEKAAPMLTVIGGKLTIFRVLAEQALSRLKKYFPQMGTAWTANAYLPGGDLQGMTLQQYTQYLIREYPQFPVELLQRYAQSYGNLTEQLLADSREITDLGKDFGGGLFEKEVEYLKHNEWAQTMEDILWRRTKLGLFLTPVQQKQLLAYLGTD